ncbi:TfuA-like protein [Bradyrhizobium sp. ARR65]|uniref:TfuA-like protein n=1 Tax=Bradyrhizobium sp. ARR65 TaxID=1040989 RepID=UPI0004667A3C|nr:TfuA-like protein [Bradyrhizobium sp. ARR65]
MSAVIFAGPSLPPHVRPHVAGFEWRPPLRRGDLYLAALQRPALIGIIDGYFETVPTVWHKEILWAMAQGIHVYGAASIGALRAAELAEFGMTGIGHIYRKFRAGELTDDDEVAVLHGPAEVNYVQVTEAMVNVRATVDRARKSGIVEPDLASALVETAKSLFYKDRTYEAILKRATGRGLAQAALDRFAAWLPRGLVDQKRIDAEEMLHAMMGHLEGGVTPLEVTYQFAHTFAWEEARQLIERASDAASDPPS